MAISSQLIEKKKYGVRSSEGEIRSILGIRPLVWSMVGVTHTRTMGGICQYREEYFGGVPYAGAGGVQV